MKKIFTILSLILCMHCQGQTIIAQYCLDGNASDGSGHGYDGTAVNCTPAIDRFGHANGAMKFDTTSYIILPPMFPSGIAYRAITAWVKIDVDSFYNAVEGCIISSGTWSNGSSFNILTNDQGQNSLTLAVDNGTYSQVVNPGINDKRWHFICLVLGGQDSLHLCQDFSHPPFVNFYVDGIIYQSDLCNALTSGQSNFIGMSNDTSSREHFRGLIDDVTIWNGVLSDSAILSLYNSTTSCAFMNIEELNANSINFYPNPLTSSTILQLNTQVTNAEVVIYDVLGKEMMRRKMDGDRMEIERGSLESGVYFVKVSTAEKQWVQKLVVE